jgi:formylglycine-generating enzyme required for sulfatase activity
LGGGATLELVRIPAGEFVMGAASGEVDERPLARVSIDEDFWMSVCEITNEQYRRFDPSHDPGLFMKRSLDVNGPGVALDGPRQPVVRVSWERAIAFCHWLSDRAGEPFMLPTEGQWEYACRAGSSTEFSFGDPGDDFSRDVNAADAAIQRWYTVTGGVIVLQDIPADPRCDDHSMVTADVASYRCNAWGLYDMHGNAAEWTLSTYRPYPYGEEDGRNSLALSGRKVVRGGSFHDRLKRCRSAYRLSYPAWQRVHNVGFRVVCLE